MGDPKAPLRVWLSVALAVFDTGEGPQRDGRSAELQVDLQPGQTKGAVPAAAAEQKDAEVTLVIPCCTGDSSCMKQHWGEPLVSVAAALRGMPRPHRWGCLQCSPQDEG